MNINQELFKRYKPENKMAIINNLTQYELLSVTPATILRIIKEAGQGSSNKSRNKFKTLYLCKRVGNNWNSKVEAVYNWKKDAVYMDVYIQGDDTDTNVECPISSLLDSSSSDRCFGKIHESFRDGYSHDKPAHYDREDRAAVVKEILRTYVIKKYNYEDNK